MKNNEGKKHEHEDGDGDIDVATNKDQVNAWQRAELELEDDGTHNGKYREDMQKRLRKDGMATRFITGTTPKGRARWPYQLQWSWGKSSQDERPGQCCNVRESIELSSIVDSIFKHTKQS